MLGLAGSHRTGKTTLAKIWAERVGVDYVTISTSQVIRDTLGFDCDKIVTMDDRLKVQRRLVQVCDETFLKRKTTFISDRTPLDVAAYTLADANQSMTPSQSEQMMEIVHDCMDLSRSCFHTMVLIPPVLPYVVEEGKPPLNLAYQRSIHHLIQGLLLDTRNGATTDFHWWSMDESILDLGQRMQVLDTVFKRTCHDIYAHAIGGSMHS